MNDSLTKALMERVKDFTYEKLDEPNIFQQMEAEQRLKFSKHEAHMHIPWYLIPLRKIVISIAYFSFVAGLNINAPPIKIKRPTPFKETNDE